MAICDPNIHEYVHRNVLTFLSKVSAHASSTEVMKCVHLPVLFLAFMCIHLNWYLKSAFNQDPISLTDLEVEVVSKAVSLAVQKPPAITNIVKIVPLLRDAKNPTHLASNFM